MIDRSYPVCALIFLSNIFRREKRREEAKIHQIRIKKEQDRLRKLEEIDRQRREKFVDKRRKTRDRIQIKRDLERERLRQKKCDDEHEVGVVLLFKRY